MKKKWLALLMCGAMAASMGVSVYADEEADAAEAEATAVTTVGPEDGTHFELWTFVDLHNEFYAKMVEEWNELNPDKQLNVTFSTYPYGDMHNKLMMSLQAGSGAPDICDIEIGQFPNYTGVDCPLYDLTDALAPYEDTMVQSRLDVYSKEDGTRVGVPTHVGATVMYWNAEIFEEYGLDYKSVKTWDDYTALGEQLKEASNGEVYLTSVDTGGVDWMWIAMAEYGEDWTGGPGGTPNVQLESVEKMMTMQQQWLNDGIAMISTDGHTDTDGCRVPISEGKIASFPKAMWYMSRFTGYEAMKTLEGKFDITTVPVFEEGQKCSVGIGGTGTVVTNECENPELAAEWLAWAKCSPEGEAHIWADLGFDVCNTALWSDEEFAYDESNIYNTFFRVKPYEVLNELAEADAIGTVYTTSASPTINDYMCTTTLNYVFEDGMDVAEALQDAQDYIDMELS
ncbi:MAG: extracellular solute-binding protein [Eubacteriales bacterium]|nr:extracellular solute-binding protein [Eubacteriales bacterium]